MGRPPTERLQKDGLKVWFDEWVVKSGDSIPAKIEEGLEHSQFGLRMSDFRFAQPSMSANAFGSDWVRLEAGTFRLRPCDCSARHGSCETQATLPILGGSK